MAMFNGRPVLFSPNFSSTIQLEEMPILTAENFEQYAGKIYQYVGNVAGTYYKGYFYMAYMDAELNYSWLRINVQPHQDISGKLTEPSSGLEVGKYFRIASLDANGHAVLECVDAPSSDMKLKIAGTVQTPASDGYVNVPTPSYNRLGVVKVNAYKGITCAADGTLEIYGMGTSDYVNRNQSHIRSMPVIAGSVDAAVKAAMTDGIGSAWTDSEKANARSRIGAINAQTILLGEATTTEDVATVAIDYADGNLLTDFDKLMLFVTFPDNSIPSGFNAPTINVKSIYGLYSKDLFYPTGSTKINTGNIHTAFTFEIIRKPTENNLDVSVIGSMVSNFNYYSPIVNSVVGGVQRCDNIINNDGYVVYGKGIQFSSLTAGVTIPSGTKIELFGVKY